MPFVRKIQRVMYRLNTQFLWILFMGFDVESMQDVAHITCNDMYVVQSLF